jgi:hypothetical protein
VSQGPGHRRLLSSTAKPPNWKNFNHKGAIRPLVCGEEGFSIKPYFFFLYAPSWLFSLQNISGLRPIFVG